MFYTDRVINGFVVAELQPGFEAFNRKFYFHCLQAGGIMAMTAQVVFEYPGVIYHNGSIVVLQELREYMTPKAFDAIMAHEMAHIINGDINVTAEQREALDKKKKLKLVMIADQEFKADAYAASLHGKQAMLDAIDQLRRFRVKKLLNVKSEWAMKMWLFLDQTPTLIRRIARLKAMSY